MQRKTAILLFTAIFFSLSKPAVANRYLFEAKIGHFHPFSDTLREQFDTGWDDYQFEFSYSPWNTCNCNWWENFFVLGSYSFIVNEGFTFSGLDDTEINIFLNTVSAGLKYIQPLPWDFDVYGSAGARYIFLRTENDDDPSVDPHETARGWGGTFSLGFLFHPTKCLVIDFYTNVMVKHFDEDNFSKDGDEIEKSLDISGITFGIGAGLRF